MRTAALLAVAGLLVPATTIDDSPEEPAQSQYEAQCSEDGETIYRPGSATVEGRESTEYLGLDSAHVYSTGENIRVALLDSGVDPSNPSMAGATIDNGADFTGQNKPHSDTWGSGTALASLIVGQNNKEAPVAGVAPDARLLPVRVITTPPNEITDAYIATTTEALVNGINWSIDNDADIIVVGIVVPKTTPELTAALTRAEEEGVLVVAPTGDGGMDPEVDPAEYDRYPAAHETVLGVTALDGNTGASDQVIHSPTIDVAAPGANVVIAAGPGTCLTGTSSPSTTYATAYAGGIAALSLATHPDETPEQIRYRLEVTAFRSTPTSRNDVFGWGQLDPTAAINFVDDGTALGPPSPVFAAPEPIETTGSDIPPPIPDKFTFTRPATITTVAIVGFTILALLLGLAGRLTGPEKRSPNEGSSTPLR